MDIEWNEILEIEYTLMDEDNEVIELKIRKIILDFDLFELIQYLLVD